MLERKRTLVLEVRDGLAVPETIALEEGRELEPASVGSGGSWRVEGEGVQEVHLFLCFDGKVLFAQSADAATPARIDGRPVPTEWLEVRPPAAIALGRVSIVYRSLSDTFDDVTDAKTTVDAPAYAAPAPKPPRPFAPGAFAQGMDDGDATRLEDPRSPVTVPRKPPRPPIAIAAPNDEATRIEAPLAPAPRTPPKTVPPAPTSSGPTVARERPAPSEHLPAVIAPPIDLPPAPRTSGPPPAPTGMALAQAHWRSASLPKKALLILMPLLVASIWVIFVQDEPPPPRPKPSASASALVPAPAPASALVPAPAPASAAPTTVAVPSPPRDDASVPPTERAAVDAVVAGSYAEAARLYDQLAAANPNRPAYAEAARILRAKLDAGR